MKPNLLFVAVFALVAGGALNAKESSRPASQVHVDFVQPEKFTDCGNESVKPARAGEPILTEIRIALENLATRYLAAGPHLSIKFADIDLAGAFEPWRGARFSEVRFFREVSPPRMELEFKLLGTDGKVIREGKRQLQDTGYLMTTVLPTWDPLRYEKEMLRKWMAREFKRSSRWTNSAWLTPSPFGPCLFF